MGTGKLIPKSGSKGTFLEKQLCTFLFAYLFKDTPSMTSHD